MPVKRKYGEINEDWFFDVLGNPHLLELIASFQGGKKWKDITSAAWCAKNGHLAPLKEKSQLKEWNLVVETALEAEHQAIIEWIVSLDIVDINELAIKACQLERQNSLQILIDLGATCSFSLLEAAFQTDDFYMGVFMYRKVAKLHKNLLFASLINANSVVFAFLIVVGTKFDDKTMDLIWKFKPKALIACLSQVLSQIGLIIGQNWITKTKNYMQQLRITVDVIEQHRKAIKLKFLEDIGFNTEEDFDRAVNLDEEQENQE